MRASLRHAAFALLTATAFAVPAFAQQPGAPSVYAACNLTSPPSKAESEGAHGAYMAGKASFDVGEYDRAIDLFKDAYRRDCTKFELLSIVARAYELKGDRVEAVTALQAYLDRAPPNDPGNEPIRQRMQRLKQQISTQPPATAQPSSTSAPAPTGSAAAAPLTSSSASTTGPSTMREHSAAPWVLVGAGAAATITGVVLLVVGLGKISDAKALCPNGFCPPAAKPAPEDQNARDATTTLNSGNTLAAVGGVVGGIGVVAVASGLIWHFAEPTGSETTSATPRFRPEARPGFAGATVVGSF